MIDMTNTRAVDNAVDNFIEPVDNAVDNFIEPVDNAVDNL